MRKSSGPVRDFMVADPWTIDSKKTLAAAHRLMREKKIRHLPVLSSGDLAGVVSLRDLHLVETLKDVDPERVTVEEAMTPSPYTVDPDTPIAEVALKMAEYKLGSAIIVRNGRVEGMFTTVDALKLLATLLGGKPRRSARVPPGARARAAPPARARVR